MILTFSATLNLTCGQERLNVEKFAIETTVALEYWEVVILTKLFTVNMPKSDVVRTKRIFRRTCEIMVLSYYLGWQ